MTYCLHCTNRHLYILATQLAKRTIASFFILLGISNLSYLTMIDQIWLAYIIHACMHGSNFLVIAAKNSPFLH